MQLTSICTKYETERELVQPFKSQTMTEHPKEALTSNNRTLKDFKAVRLFNDFFSIHNEKKIQFSFSAQFKCRFKDGTFLDSFQKC